MHTQLNIIFEYAVCLKIYKCGLKSQGWLMEVFLIKYMFRSGIMFPGLGHWKSWIWSFVLNIFLKDECKVILQGKLIAVAYT